MKNQEQLYYDDSCPLCNWYSKKFVDMGLLSTNGRCQFEEIQTRIDQGHADPNKVNDFIPLYLPEEEKSLYGVDSLLHLIGKKYPTLKKIGNLKVIHFLAEKLYKLVSYNRRIIVPNYKAGQNDVAEPSFNYKYRWIFILFCAVISSFITWNFALYTSLSALIFVAIAGGWVLFISGTKLFLNIKDWTGLVGHTSITMLRGVIIFGLSIPFLAHQNYVLVAMLILVSFIDMNRQMFKRMKLIKQNQLYFLWLLALTSFSVITLLTSLNLSIWTF